VNVTPDVERGPQKYDVKGKNVPNGHRKLQPRLTRAKNRESKKRGCWCKFNVKYLYYVRDIAEIMYYSPRHANEDSFVVHCEVRKGDRAWYATQISAEIRTWVVNCLLAGVPIAKIMSMHIERALQVPLGMGHPQHCVRSEEEHLQEIPKRRKIGAPMGSG
jgi:hypothetical protein